MSDKLHQFVVSHKSNLQANHWHIISSGSRLENICNRLDLNDPQTAVWEDLADGPVACSTGSGP